MQEALPRLLPRGVGPGGIPLGFRVGGCAEGFEREVLQVLGTEAGALAEAKVLLRLEGFQGVNERGARVGGGGLLGAAGARLRLGVAPEVGELGTCQGYRYALPGEFLLRALFNVLR